MFKRQNPSVRQHADRKQEVMASVVSARQLLFFPTCIVVDFGKGPVARTPLILDKKEETTEKPAGDAKRDHPFPPPLPSSPSLKVWMHHCYLLQFFRDDVLFRKRGHLGIPYKIQTIL